MYCILKTKNKGFGVFSNINIPKHTNIGSYITKNENKYGRKITDDFWEDELGRYVNHSTEPNCEMSLIDDTYHLFSLFDIKIGDELVIDYTIIEKILKVDGGIFMGDFPNGPKLTDFGQKST